MPAPTFSNSYAYDAASNRTSFTAPDGSTNTYSYDTLGRLTTLTNSGAGSFTMGYDVLSRRTQLTRPNGIATSYAYDPVSHLQSILHKLGANTLDGAAYGYDLAGNRTSKTNQLNSTVSNYAYDNIYQLTGVTQGANSTEAYTFDTVGNRLSSLSVPSYTYNSSNEITAAGPSSSYTYDNDGNTLTKTDGTGSTTFTWDFENRLTSVQPPGQTTVTFKYDPFGRRIQKGGSVFVYDGANLIEETDGTGSLTARYVFGPGIDEPLAAYRGAIWEFYEADGLGSIISLSTATGAVSDSYVYDSFGNVSSSTGSFSQPFRYTGREWDGETGFYYYRARYYDPQGGRFLNEDPTSFDGGINFYGYAANNPIAFIDPSGLDATVTQNGTDVTVTANIVLHSDSQIMAMFYNQAIDYFWNRKGNYFHYGKCTIKFNIKVVLARGPRPKATVNDVYLKYSPTYIHSHVTNHNRAVVWTGASAWTIAHETAHLLNLPDEYTTNPDGTSTPKPGWDNDMLADPDSEVTQKDLELLLKDKGCKCK